MFQITALPRETFANLFALDDSALAKHGALRVTAGEGGYPCRVSLAEAAPGEQLILTHYEHQPAATPFRASHAVYVRAEAEQAHPAPGEVPASLRDRILSLRAFDAAGMMSTPTWWTGVRSSRCSTGCSPIPPSPIFTPIMPSTAATPHGSIGLDPSSRHPGLEPGSRFFCLSRKRQKKRGPGSSPG